MGGSSCAKRPDAQKHTVTMPIVTADFIVVASTPGAMIRLVATDNAIKAQSNPYFQ
jgi:hypothetical protein